MARYIDAEKLIEGLSNTLVRELDVIDVIAIVSEQPTSDVVEVVRCKDCEFASYLYSAKKYMCKKGCGATKCETDFCSYGFRKNNFKE